MDVFAAADPARTLQFGQPEEVGMSSARLADVAARLQDRVNRTLIPGAVIWVARHGKTVLHQAFGVRQAGMDAMTEDTLFDLESNTKVLATAISYMILMEHGVIHLTDPVARYLPHFATNGKAHVTIGDMLRYSPGLPVDINLPGAPALSQVPSPDALWTLMEETSLEYPTGTKVEYSDLTYRLLGQTLEAITSQNLQQFAHANVWSKLGMTRTAYNPLQNGFSVDEIAATGPGSWNLRTNTIRGVVEDDFDWVMGGIVGCDGLFSTARDIAVFLQMILNRGAYGGVRIVSPQTVELMTDDHTPQVNETVDADPISNLLFTHKGYGWELWTHRFSSGGMRLTPGSFGKAGGAGTFFGPALGAAIMTFFARVTSDLTRSWLLYQGLIFVIVMLFVPDGVGGLISVHARRLRASAFKHLTLPYLVCLVVGVLLLVGVVFTVESVHVVLSDAYAVLRRANGGALVPYRLFGRQFHPRSPWTWAIPLVSILVGAALLPVARRLTRDGWSRAVGESAA